MLPEPSLIEQEHSRLLCQMIRERIDSSHGWIPFSQYMDMALYTPKYGYYNGGAVKIGAEGDFITAPTLSPLFGTVIANQLNQLLPQTDGCIYEFGAGTGALALSLIQHINPDVLKAYYIIEVSPDLAQKQSSLLAQHLSNQDYAKIVHLSELPEQFDGIVIGNEVLDAMPVEIMQWNSGSIHRMGISVEQEKLVWQSRPAPESLKQLTEQLPISSIDEYTSEIHPQQQAWVHTVAQKMQRGAILMIDYGFDAQQYYHPQRNQGTLIGHYRHHTIHDVLYYPGLVDITAHVNFTAIADAGVASGLELIGYTTQANFLINLGIAEILQEHGQPSDTKFIQAASACQVLLSPHEMGELFKVIALGKNIDTTWQGFCVGDITHKL